MVEKQFLLAAQLISPVPSIPPHSAALFLTSISTLIHLQPLIFLCLILVYSILPKKKDIKREEDTTRLLGLNVTEGYQTEGDA